MIYTFVRDVGGLDMPCPSLSDLTLAGAITTVIIWLLHITGQTQG
jgi:hypothetical protein